MENNTKNKPMVLSCIDGSSFSEAVCDYSNWIAKTVNAPLTFLHTIEHHQMPAVADLSGSIGLGASEDLLNELTEVEQSRGKLLIKKGNLMLQAAKQKAAEAKVENINIRQRHGSLEEALIELEDSIRVLVVGIRGEQHESKSGGVGEQLETIIRSLHKPILVVNKTFSLPEKIMLAYDGGDAAKKALDMVISSPLFKSTPCHLVHVVSDENHVANDAILQEAENKLKVAGIDVTAVTLAGKIEEVLAGYQANNHIDLTLMGAFSHNRVRDFLLGSFTAKMLEATQRPLLLLR
ncbi:MAG: universal stress protein [Cellvibrionaceae bacterium]